jgi:hypothetical protein
VCKSLAFGVELFFFEGVALGAILNGTRVIYLKRLAYKVLSLHSDILPKTSKMQDLFAQIFVTDRQRCRGGILCQRRRNEQPRDSIYSSRISIYNVTQVNKQ